MISGGGENEGGWQYVETEAGDSSLASGVAVRVSLSAPLMSLPYEDDPEIRFDRKHRGGRRTTAPSEFKERCDRLNL
jgi:hypothetical protein